MRHNRTRPYSSPPQAPTYSPDTLPSIYGTEAIVSLAIRGDENCREFLGYRISSELPPLNPETHAVCSNPFCKHDGKAQPLEQFYRDNRKRNGKTSECRTCMNRRRVIRYHDGKIETIRRLKARV